MTKISNNKNVNRPESEISSLLQYGYYFNNSLFDDQIKNSWYKNLFIFFNYENTEIINFNYDETFYNYFNFYFNSTQEKDLFDERKNRLLYIHGRINNYNTTSIGKFYKIKYFDPLIDLEFSWFIKKIDEKIIWTQPSLGFNDKEYEIKNPNNFNETLWVNKVHKVIFFGFGFHETNLSGIAWLNENKKIYKNFNIKIIIIAGNSFDDSNNDAKSNIKNLFSEFDPDFIKKIETDEDKTIISTDKVLLIKKNCEKLDENNWEKMRDF
ncbi:hypothetical protein JTY60_01275 [symbiont of Argiope bruennichi]|uniref:hypothetical protein n=1 Tax=symbiont of Argiope bruennichi TaxID=2810479 RepID=UPI003DA64E5B